MQDAISMTLYHIFSQKYDHDDPLVTFHNSIVADMFHVYKKGDVIFQQGHSIDYFYILLKGRAIILNSMSGTNGNIFHAMMPLDIMGLPDYLGGSTAYTSHVIAKTPCTVFRIPQRTFISLITTDPALCYSTLRILGQISSNSLRNQEINAIFQPRKRLGYYLYLAAQPGRPFTCPYTREELADTLVINQRSLHRYLAAMEDDSCLELRKGKIRIEEKHYKKLSELYDSPSEDI